LDTLRSQISEHTSERMRFESQLEASEEVEKNYHDWLKKRQELEKWEEIAANFRQHDGERAAPLTAIEAQRARLQQELHALEQEQQQVNDNQSQLTELNQQWLAGKSDVDKLAQKLDRHQEVEETLRTLVQKQSEADGENKHLKEQMEVLKERIEKISRAEGVECPLCGQPLKPKDRKSLLKQLQSEGSSKGDQFRLNKAFIEQSQEQKSSLESELATFPGIENDLRTKSRITDQITDHIEQIQKAV
jgi:exonuclease SbcC